MTYQKFCLGQGLTMTLMMGYSIPLRHKVAKRRRQLEADAALPAKIKSGLLEYRHVRTFKTQVDAVTSLFDLILHLSP